MTYNYSKIAFFGEVNNGKGAPPPLWTGLHDTSEVPTVNESASYFQRYIID